MSVVTQPAPQPPPAGRICCKCNEPRPPEGGVQLSPQRWKCGACWRGFAMRRKTTA